MSRRSSRGVSGWGGPPVGPSRRLPPPGYAYSPETGTLPPLRGWSPVVAPGPSYGPRERFFTYYPTPPRRVVSPRRTAAWDVPSGITVRNPRVVDFCRSRKARRQVLFALRRAGFSGSARKRSWRRTRWSSFSC